MRNDEKLIERIYSDDTVDYYRNHRANALFNEYIVNPVFREKAIALGVLKRKTLDIGCGYGADMEFFVNRGASDLTGMDISQACVNAVIGNGKLKHLDVLKGSVYEIPFENAFEVAVSNMTLDQVENLEDAFRSVAAALKTGGDFLFSLTHPINSATNDYDFPLQNYFAKGVSTFQPKTLNKKIFCFKRTFGDISSALFRSRFVIVELLEPKPAEDAKSTYPEQAELYKRLPAALIVRARKVTNKE